MQKGRGKEGQEQINFIQGQNSLPRHPAPICHVSWPRGPRQAPLTTWKKGKSWHTLPSWKFLEASATTWGGQPLDCPGNVVRPSFSSWARVSPYLATVRAPGPPCLYPPSLATRAPGALLASGCALPSHVHPFVKTESRSVSVPVRLYGEVVARLTLPSVKGS